MRTFTVHAHYDNEAHVWWADSDDVPGMATEAPDLEQLHDNVQMLAPDLLSENLGYTQPFEISLVKV
jgi:hypothetical protein